MTPDRSDARYDSSLARSALFPPNAFHRRLGICLRKGQQVATLIERRLFSRRADQAKQGRKRRVRIDDERRSTGCDRCPHRCRSSAASLGSNETPSRTRIVRRLPAHASHRRQRRINRRSNLG